MGTRRRSPRPSVITVAKDLILFGAGLLIIYKQGWQASKDDFNWISMAFGIGLTQAPGAMAVVTLLRTGSPSSLAQPESPSLPPSSSPSNDSLPEEA